MASMEMPEDRRNHWRTCRFLLSAPTGRTPGQGETTSGGSGRWHRSASGGRRFTAEYKAEAVKRLEENGNSVQQVADELGLPANQLRGWRNEQLAVGSAEALAKQKAEAAELVRLRREVKRLAQENEILKRAAAFFAKEAVPS
jgi:transposase